MFVSRTSCIFYFIILLNICTNMLHLYMCDYSDIAVNVTATCINNWSVWHAVRGRLLLLLHSVSSRLPNTATSRATNVDRWRPSSIQPQLIQERQSVPQHFGVSSTVFFFVIANQDINTSTYEFAAWVSSTVFFFVIANQDINTSTYEFAACLCEWGDSKICRQILWN